MNDIRGTIITEHSGTGAPKGVSDIVQVLYVLERKTLIYCPACFPGFLGSCQWIPLTSDSFRWRSQLPDRNVIFRAVRATTPNDNDPSWFHFMIRNSIALSY